MSQTITCLGQRSLRTAFALVMSAALSYCGYEPRLLPGTDLPLADYMNRVVTLASTEDVHTGRVLPNSYIVTFREDIGAPQQAFKSFHSEYQHYYAPLASRYLADPRLVDINYINRVDMQVIAEDDPAATDIAAPPALRFAWQKQPRLPQIGIITEVNFRDPVAATAILQKWETDHRIWFAEPNYISELITDQPKKAAAALTATANAYGAAQPAYQALGATGWWHKKIKLDQAYTKLAAVTSDLASPVIAVLDSGADIENPILKGRIWENPAPGQSGCRDDLYGCDTTRNAKGILGEGSVFPYSTSGFNEACPARSDGRADESCAHGTHVAGIIAGNVASNSGVGGVCPVCYVMVIKIIKNVGGKGVALDSAILNGLTYLTHFKKADNGSSVVRVANTSFGKYTRSRAVAVLVSALKSSPNSILLIGAAGNEDSMLRVYPAALNDAIAVSATGADDQKAYYSNFGPWVDIAAPGGRDGLAGLSAEASLIVSAVPGGTAEPKQGTSMASPVVAGVAGILLSYDPDRSWGALRDSLLRNADYDALYQSGTMNDRFYNPKQNEDQIKRALLGWGLLDANAAIDGPGTAGHVPAGLTRINRGCSVIGRPTGRSVIICLLLILPLLGLRRRRSLPFSHRG